jgi:uncharacterized protein
MKLIHKILFFISFLILIPVTTSYAVQPPIPRVPSRYVEDLAGIINDNIELQLNGHLQELEQKTTAQMVVLTIKSLEGESLEDLSIEIAHNRWKLGQKGKDNGILLIVALQDRKYRFEIGYGLEGPLPDSLVGSIGRTYLVPYFREGDYSTGIFTASLAVISEIATDAGVEITGMPQVRTPSPDAQGQRRKPSLLGSVFTILFFIGLIYLFIKHPRLLLFLIMMNMLGGGRRGGWAGGGGFGGGGFGGGGGGGFGGGGAGGSW